VGVLSIENDGQRILASNYWESEMAARGLCYCSVNAGAIRVLVPLSRSDWLADMVTARYCVLSRGPWPAMGISDAVEIMWEDDSQAPFALHLTPDSFDALPAKPPEGQPWTVTVWVLHDGQPRQVVGRPCHWRRVGKIPCLRPWK
jgi:hypothetical protein